MARRQNRTPTGSVAELDGTASQGVSEKYARADHKHAIRNLPSAGQQAAMCGTSGTPGDDNQFVTDSDPRFAATYVTAEDETDILPGARQLLAGTGITLDASVDGELTINAPGGFSVFVDTTFLTENDETADLPASRRVLAGANIAFDDTTPGQRTISTPSNVSAAATMTDNALVRGDGGSRGIQG